MDYPQIYDHHIENEKIHKSFHTVSLDSNIYCLCSEGSFLLYLLRFEFKYGNGKRAYCYSRVLFNENNRDIVIQRVNCLQ